MRPGMASSVPQSLRDRADGSPFLSAQEGGPGHCKLTGVVLGGLLLRATGPSGSLEVKGEPRSMQGACYQALLLQENGPGLHTGRDFRSPSLLQPQPSSSGQPGPFPPALAGTLSPQASPEQGRSPELGTEQASASLRNRRAPSHSVLLWPPALYRVYSWELDRKRAAPGPGAATPAASLHILTPCSAESSRKPCSSPLLEGK